jgi:hypothetical protein
MEFPPLFPSLASVKVPHAFALPEGRPAEPVQGIAGRVGLRLGGGRRDRAHALVYSF